MKQSGASGPSKKIGILFYAPFPWNRGIYLVATALRAAGHRVVIYCPEGRLGESDDTGLEVVRSPAGSRLPVYADPRWLIWLLRRIRADGVDVLWARDLPLMPLALVAGKLASRPVCFDMRENFPAAFLARRVGEPGVVRRLVHRLLVATERIAGRNADHLFVVVEEQKARLVADGLRPDRITVNVTTPDATFLAGCAAPRVEPDRDGLRAVYAGHFFAFRGLKLLLEGLAVARGCGAEICLTLAGGGGRGDDQMLRELLTLARDLDIEDAVSVVGWIKPADLPGFLAGFDVGIIANEPSEHTETTVPGKLFEYMACGLIVLSSDLSPVRRIVESEGVGHIFEPYTSAELGSLLASLAELGAQGRHGMRTRSWEAARARYNWGHQSRALIDAVARLPPRV